MTATPKAPTDNVASHDVPLCSSSDKSDSESGIKMEREKKSEKLKKHCRGTSLAAHLLLLLQNGRSTFLSNQDFESDLPA